MQNTIIPNARFVHWIYVLISLFVATVLLVVNLPHITKLSLSLSGWKDYVVSRIYQTLALNLNLRQRQAGSDPGDVDEEVELQDPEQRQRRVRTGEV